MIMTSSTMNSGKRINLISQASKLGIELYSPNISSNSTIIGDADVINDGLFISEYSTTTENVTLKATGFNPDEVPVMTDKGNVTVTQEYFIKDNE